MDGQTPELSAQPRYVGTEPQRHLAVLNARERDAFDADGWIVVGLLMAPGQATASAQRNN